VITCHLYRDGKVVEERFEPSRVSEVLSEDRTMVWLDLEDPSEADLAMLEEEFSLPRVAVDALRERDQRPRVDSLGVLFFVAMYAFAMENGKPVPKEIHAFVGPKYLVTLRYSPLFDLTQVRHRWEEESERAVEGGGFLLHALMDEVVDTYLEVLDDFELAAEEIEGRVFAEPDVSVPERTIEAVQKDIFTAKRDLFEFRRRVLPLREVLDLLQEERRVVTHDLKPDYKDLADHVVRTLEQVETVREGLTSAVNAQLTLASHRLNEVIKKLTSWAAIILIPTLIAGIYGMNFFRPFPAYDHPAGFWIAIGMMVVLSAALYWFFRRRDWL
jgi:magnesium transporter